MKVGFDISQLAHRGGVVTYTQNLANHLDEDSSLEMIYFYSSLRKKYQGNLKNVKKFFIPPTLLNILFNKLHNISIESFLGPLDIFHSSDWLQPPAKAKKVTTYHDVVPLKYPQWSHPRIIRVHQQRLKWVEKEIDMVVVVSESTKKDLLEISSIPAEKIIVIYEAAGEQFKPQDTEKIQEFKKRLQLPEDFVLAIGGVGERRNLTRVKQAAENFHLVIPGETIPWVDDNDLPLLYSAAKVLFYPSLYEGFGLPVIEAMACGTAVITSNTSALPEVGGDAAVYVNPESVEEMTKKLGEVMKDQKLRSQLISKGLQQAQKFSWEKCAQQTAEVYRFLLNRG